MLAELAATVALVSTTLLPPFRYVAALVAAELPVTVPLVERPAAVAREIQAAARGGRGVAGDGDTDKRSRATARQTQAAAVRGGVAVDRAIGQGYRSAGNVPAAAVQVGGVAIVGNGGVAGDGAIGQRWS